MSFDINWDQLVGDGSINESIKQFLDKQFSNLELPSYINNLSVSNFSLGTNPPEITIRHIGDPFDEFYEDEDEEGDDLGKNDLINHGLVYKDFDVDDHSESESESDEEDKDLSDVEDRDIRSNTTMGVPEISIEKMEMVAV